MTRFFAIASLTAVLAAPAYADWRIVNNNSRVSFVTTKAGQIGEVHKFRTISGTIDSQGSVSISIDLASVDTLIPIRDERMRDILFEVADFPTARITGRADAARINSLADGGTAVMNVEGALEMRGQTLPMTMEFLVAKVSNSRIVVSSLQPILVNAAQVDLVEGVEALREIAGLPSISPAVPVSVVLTLDETR